MQVAAALSKRFPERELYKALVIFDKSSAFGNDLKASVVDEHCRTISAWLGGSLHDIKQGWMHLKDFCCSRCDPHRLAPDAEENLLLAFLRSELPQHSREPRLAPAFKRALERRLIMNKSSAHLERDFKAMRLLSDAALGKMENEVLSRRLKVALDAPQVIEEHIEGKKFIDEVVEEIMARRSSNSERWQPSVGAKGHAKKRGRPPGSGKVQKKRARAKTKQTYGSSFTKKLAHIEHLKRALEDVDAGGAAELIQKMVGKDDPGISASETLLAQAREAAQKRADEVARAEKMG